MFLYRLIMLFWGGVQKQSRARAKTPPSPKMGSRAPGTAGTAGLAPDSPSRLLREESPGAVARSDRILGSASPRVAIDGPPMGRAQMVGPRSGAPFKKLALPIFFKLGQIRVEYVKTSLPGFNGKNRCAFGENRVDFREGLFESRGAGAASGALRRASARRVPSIYVKPP